MKNHRMIQLRLKKHLTQQELAEEVGMSQSMISAIEAGAKDTKRAQKIKIANFFGVSVEYLFYAPFYESEVKS